MVLEVEQGKGKYKTIITHYEKKIEEAPVTKGKNGGRPLCFSKEGFQQVGDAQKYLNMSQKISISAKYLVLFCKKDLGEPGQIGGR